MNFREIGIMSLVVFVMTFASKLILGNLELWISGAIAGVSALLGYFIAKAILTRRGAKKS